MDLLDLTSTDSDGFPKANLFIVHCVPGFALARLRFFGLLTHLSSGACLANTCRLNRFTKLPQGRGRGREVGRHPPGGGSKMTGPWGGWEAAAPPSLGEVEDDGATGGAVGGSSPPPGGVDRVPWCNTWFLFQSSEPECAHSLSRFFRLRSRLAPFQRSAPLAVACSVEPWPTLSSRTSPLLSTGLRAVGQQPVLFASSPCRTMLRRKSSPAAARRSPRARVNRFGLAHSTTPRRSPRCGRYFRPWNRQPDFPWHTR